MSRSYPSPVCKACMFARNTISGLYCTRLATDIEYKSTPVCQTPR